MTVVADIYRDALAWASARKIVLPDIFYNMLGVSARQKAFTVSGVNSLNQLQTVLDSLNAAVQTGQTFDQWKTDVTSGKIKFSVPKNRLETIFRTNIQSSYMAGITRQQLRNVDNRPYFMYDAINDSRTRPAHAELDGYVASYDDPFWAEHTAPLGYNCRCSRIALSAQEAQARGLGTRPEPLVQADPGFGSTPLANGGFKGIKQAEEKALADADPDLVHAYQNRMQKAPQT